MKLRNVTLATAILLALTGCGSSGGGGGSSTPNSEVNNQQNTQAQVEQQKAEVEALKKQLTEAQNGQKQAQSQLNAAEKNASDKLATAQQNLAKLQRNVADLQAKLAEAEKKFTTSQNNQTALQNQLNTAKTDLANAKAAKTASENALKEKEAELKNLPKDQQAFNKQLTAKNNEITEIKKNLATLENNVKQAEEKVKTAEVGLQSANKEKSTLQNQLAQTQKALQTAEAAKVNAEKEHQKQLKAKETELDNAQKALAQQNTKLKEAEANLTQAQTAMAQSAKEKATLETQLAEANKTLDNAKAEKAQAEKDLQAQVTAKENELAKVQANLTARDKQLKQAEANLKTAEANLQKGNADKNTLQAELKRAKADLENAQVAKTEAEKSLQATITEKEQFLAKAQENLTASETKANQAEAEKTKLDQKLKAVNQELETVKQAKEKAEAALAEKNKLLSREEVLKFALNNGLYNHDANDFANENQNKPLAELQAELNSWHKHIAMLDLVKGSAYALGFTSDAEDRAFVAEMEKANKTLEEANIIIQDRIKQRQLVLEKERIEALNRLVDIAKAQGLSEENSREFANDNSYLLPEQFSNQLQQRKNELIISAKEVGMNENEAESFAQANINNYSTSDTLNEFKKNKLINIAKELGLTQKQAETFIGNTHYYYQSISDVKLNIENRLSQLSNSAKEYGMNEDEAKEFAKKNINNYMIDYNELSEFKINKFVSLARDIGFSANGREEFITNRTNLSFDEFNTALQERKQQIITLATEAGMDSNQATEFAKHNLDDKDYDYFVRSTLGLFRSDKLREFAMELGMQEEDKISSVISQYSTLSLSEFKTQLQNKKLEYINLAKNAGMTASEAENFASSNLGGDETTTYYLVEQFRRDQLISFAKELGLSDSQAENLVNDMGYYISKDELKNQYQQKMAELTRLAKDNGLDDKYATEFAKNNISNSAPSASEFKRELFSDLLSRSGISTDNSDDFLSSNLRLSSNEFTKLLSFIQLANETDLSSIWQSKYGMNGSEAFAQENLALSTDDFKKLLVFTKMSNDTDLSKKYLNISESEFNAKLQERAEFIKLAEKYDVHFINNEIEDNLDKSLEDKYAVIAEALKRTESIGGTFIYSNEHPQNEVSQTPTIKENTTYSQTERMAKVYNQKYSIISGGYSKDVNDGYTSTTYEQFNLNNASGLHTLKDAMPVEGTATYKGKAFNYESDGDLTYTVNFTEKNGSGKITGIANYGDITLEKAEIKSKEVSKQMGIPSGRASSALANETSGGYSLEFYGPKAEEISGSVIFSFDGYDGRQKPNNIVGDGSYMGSHIGFGGTRGEIQK